MYSDTRFRNTRDRSLRAVVTLSTALAFTVSGALIASSADAAPPPRYLLVGGMGNSKIGVISVTRDGAMSVVKGSPFASRAGFPLVISNDAKTAYVGNLDGYITAHKIGANGTLTNFAPGSLKVDKGVIGLALSPDGSRLFATIGNFFGSNEIHSYSVAASGAITPTGAPATVIPGNSALSQPAVSPDGRFLFVSSVLAGTVTSFAIAANGSVSLVGSVLAGSAPVLPAITPNGRFLYVTNEQSSNMSGYAVGADGTLTPTPGSPYATGGLPHGAAFTPDSRRLYLPEAGGGTVSGFEIAADGALTPLPGSPYPAPSGSALPGRVVLSPDARQLYVIDVLGLLQSKVHSYTIGSGGSLAWTGATVKSGVLFADGPSSSITPNQGPIAALSIAGVNGPTYTFSAQGSSDSDGTVARYDWNFGNGQTATTTTPQVTHTYSASGLRNVTVTVSDDEGCSTERVFTGQMVSCNGGPRARAAVAVSVP